MSNYKLSSNEAITVMVNLMCNKLLLSAPGSFTAAAGNAGWMSVLIVFAVTACVWIFYCRRYPRFSGLDLLDLCQKVGGKPLKLTVGSILSIFMVFLTAIAFRQYIENVKQMSLVSTPLSLIGILFAAGMILGAYTGLKSVAKVHSFFTPLIFIFIAVLLAMAFPHYDTTNLFPALGKGGKSILGGGFFLLSTLFEFILLFFLPPLLKDEKKQPRIGKWSIAISCLYFLMVISAFILAIPSPASTDRYLPIFQVIRLIQIGTFFQRLESVFLMIFTISGFLYLSTMLFFTVYLFQKTFGIEYGKPLVFPMGFLVCAIGSIHFFQDRILAFLQFSNVFVWVIPILLPLTLLFLYRWRSAR